MFLWVALMVWWFTYFRPSGHERWGDAAILFYAFFIASPITLLLGAVAGFWAHRVQRTSEQSLPWLTVFLGAIVTSLIVLPWSVLIGSALMANVQ